MKITNKNASQLQLLDEQETIATKGKAYNVYAYVQQLTSGNKIIKHLSQRYFLVGNFCFLECPFSHL